MKLENAQILMNRYLDGVATGAEREQLARAMQADPMLRSEFEDLESVHASTQSLFKQLTLPADFSTRVMRRVQGVEVPSDQTLDAVRLPAQRPLRARPKAMVTHRKRAQVYAIIATLSAAAAVTLAIGVLTGFFARAGIGTQGMNAVDTELAEGRQGGPDREELNRTDSSSLPPSKTDKRDENATDETPATDKPETRPEPEVPEVVEKPETETPESRDPISQPDPLPKEPKATIEEPRVPEPVPQETPEKEPRANDTTKDTTVEEGDSPTEEPKPATDSVDQEPREDKTEAVPVERIRIGSMLVLNGKADLLDSTGGAQPMGEEQAVFQGDRIRTSVNGLIVLRTDAGDVTVYRQSEVTMTSDSEIDLGAGTVTLDRKDDQRGTDLAVKADDYMVYLNHGCAVIERKRRGLAIQKALGFVSVSHEEFGTVLLDAESGYELDVEFGKAAGEPRATAILLSDWSAESRAKAVMLAVQPALNERGYPSREFKYVADRLPGRLEKVMRHPAGTGAVTNFLLETLGNEKFDGGTLILMMNELEIAYLEVTELTPEMITRHASSAALVGEDFSQWKDYFYRLMRPPVIPKKPIPGAGGDTECPNEGKIKRGPIPPTRK